MRKEDGKEVGERGGGEEGERPEERRSGGTGIIEIRRGFFCYVII